MLGITFSIQARAFDLHKKDTAFALTEKFDNAAFIITNTNYNRNYINSLMTKNTRNNIHRVYNGIDISQFKPKEKIATQSKRIIRLITVARLTEQKGITYLLNACRILLDQGYRFEWHIIGAPNSERWVYYIQIKQLYHELGLKETVKFRGALPFAEILDEYRKSDIFVLPCVIAENGGRDIIPNVVIEAMAMKLPVISTTITGLPEMVDHQTSGLLVPPKNESELAAAVIKLLEDPALRKRFGENGRKIVEEKFNIHKNILSYHRLFGEVLDSPEE